MQHMNLFHYFSLTSKLYQHLNSNVLTLTSEIRQSQLETPRHFGQRIWCSLLAHNQPETIAHGILRPLIRTKQVTQFIPRRKLVQTRTTSLIYYTLPNKWKLSINSMLRMTMPTDKYANNLANKSHHQHKSGSTTLLISCADEPQG